MVQCRAKSKQSGERCKRHATVSTGRGLCHIHGGAPKTGVNPDKPVQITHGRYSKSVPADIAERYEYFKTDPDILSLKPDVALSRAMMERFIGGAMQEGTVVTAEIGAELRAWFDLNSKLAERCDKILNGERYTINVQGLQAIMAQIVDIINTAIDGAGLDAATADNLRDSISGGLAAIHGSGPSLPTS